MMPAGGVLSLNSVEVGDEMGGVFLMTGSVDFGMLFVVWVVDCVLA